MFNQRLRRPIGPNSSDELLISFAQNLASKKAEESVHSDLVKRAFDNLDKAARLLENAGLDDEAELVTKAMQKCTEEE